MQVIVTFRNTKPTEGLRRHAVDRIERIGKFIRRPIEAHAILSVHKHRHVAEVQVNGNHLNLTAKEETGDLYSAIDLAVSKLERQAKKHAEKAKKHKGGAGVATPVARAVKGPSLPRPRKVAVPTMSIAAAVAELEARDDELLVFENAAGGALCIVYRRKDGRVGLIEPSLA